MKKLALSLAALTLTVGGALAADLPSRKAAPILPPPPPPPMWTGFYVGLNAGGSWANSNTQTITVAPVANNFMGDAGLADFSYVASAIGSNGGNGGFIGGGQIGYNWQLPVMGGSIVTGVEADIQGMASGGGSRNFTNAITNSYGHPWVGNHSVSGNMDYLGTVRGRLGYLLTPTLLAYGTGGFAYGGVTINTSSLVYNVGWDRNPTSVGGTNFADTRVGWTAGGGVEWMFMPNWSAKAEYLYYDLGSLSQNFTMPVTATNGGEALFAGQVKARVSGNIVRAGINYHFNWGASAPVIAKY